jgi:hypothetical protein
VDFLHALDAQGIFLANDGETSLEERFAPTRVPVVCEPDEDVMK